MKLTFSTTINGLYQQVQAAANRTLMEFLRHDLKLKGTVEGCSVGVCGSCTVLIDGKPVSSCLTLGSNIADKQVTTIEGLARDDDLDPVQQAFLKHQAFPVSARPA
jgi:xanthine dehydrogenase YagT iron-sulfur-binding subunit